MHRSLPRVATCSRNDWLITLFEEVIGAVLWFNPVIWLLLSQTRLAREQLVDAEVVRLTESREAYIDALIGIGRGSLQDLAPAPLFLRKRHLTHRLYLRLRETLISPRRLLGSCGCMIAILAATAWGAVTGSVHLQEAPSATLPPTAPTHRAAQAVITAQTRAAKPLPRVPIRAADPSLPPLPTDPHEPPLVNVQVAQSPGERAAALGLLEKARQNSELHTVTTLPWRFTGSFNAVGDGANTGAGEIRETWFNGQRWTWSMKLGGYSLTRVRTGGPTVESA
jgi:hypothetical protein